jgi:hypothetical protein
MKSSIFVAASGALLAMAGPIEKRHMTTEIEWVYETVTVTAGAEPTKDNFVPPAPSPEPEHEPEPVGMYPTVVAPPPPPPSSSAAPEVVYPTVVAPPPVAPTTFVPEPTTSAAPAPTFSAAPLPQPEVPETPDDDSMEGQAIYHHNLHRSNHSAPAMSWDSEIAGYAQQVADSCVFAHDKYVPEHCLRNELELHANLFQIPRRRQLWTEPGHVGCK